MADAAEGMGDHSRIVLKRFRAAHTDSQQTSLGRFFCMAEGINTLKALLLRKGSIGRHRSFTGRYRNNENEFEAKSMDWCHSLHLCQRQGAFFWPMGNGGHPFCLLRRLSRTLECLA